ncbi:MAG: aminoacyl-tRNA hydrolase [Gammaproteobacteria bacterium]|nr:aminoacyl-tRNA hydrolase [Gammaproteobacteria bacterium]
MPEPSPGIALVVGLGNPGREYARTRHNAGFWFVDALARLYGADFRPEAKFRGELCSVVLDGREMRLFKPATYMNLSGQAVAGLAGFYKLPLSTFLVAHDDLDLPPGVARLKRGGGHGGHNGLRDLIERLGGDFMRLRLGIGHPGVKDQVTDYVLSRAPAGDEALIREAIAAAVAAMPLVIRGELERAMQQLHSAR